MPSKKFFYIILTLAIVVVVFLLWPNNKTNVVLDKNLKIIAFGDSLVQGVGASKGNDFVSRLSQKTGVNIVNAGVSGNTTIDGLLRLQKDVLDKKPDVVILLLGGNDALKQISVEQTFGNLENMINQIKQGGAKVLLLGVRGGVVFIGKNYDPEFESLAKKTNTVLVPDVLDGLFGNKEFMSDGIHPNDAGYEKIANKIWQYLPRIFK